jgi:hypothetical protein
MTGAAGSPGKTMFVKEFLIDNPQGNADAVNKAWRAAGFHGTISVTLVHQMRAQLGLTGNLRRTTKTSTSSATGRGPGRPRQGPAAATVDAQPRPDLSTAASDMETDIDRLIFKTMALGHLTEIEDTLRRARRMLYDALNPG